MSDWADETSRKICARFGGGWMDDEIAEVAAALRQARIEALEEAASLIDDCEPGLAEWIRQLKDKQP